MFSWLTRLKLVIVVVGLLVFAWGMRSDEVAIRWIGVGIVGIAWALRFVDMARKRREEAASPEGDE